MDLHKITALPHSHLVKEKTSAARMGSYEVGVQGRGERPFAPLTAVLLHPEVGRRMRVDSSSMMRPEGLPGRHGRK